MRRAGWAVAVLLLLAGCGIEPSGVTDGGDAPTGVAPGMTLYFIDAGGALTPQQHDTDSLGTISDALSLLLASPDSPERRTEIADVGVTRVGVVVDGDTIELRVPLAGRDVTPRGIDQIVCTAIAAHVQRGGSLDSTVRIIFTVAGPGADRARTCPVIG
jgi:hypothetical protein